MDPVAFTLGPLSIRWYGIMAALGFLAAVSIAVKNRKYADMSQDQVYNLLLLTMVSGILGARVCYILQYPGQFRNNLMEIVRIDHGGLVFYGGFIAAMIAIAVYCRKNRLNLLDTLSFIAPSLALGHAISRVGCFLNGCCYGSPTGTYLGYAYPANTAPHNHYPGIHIHPVQLYETAGNLLIFAIMQYLLPKCRGGQLAGLYMILYSILRFSDEFLRGDYSADKYTWGLFTPAQMICFILLPAGIALYIYSSLKKDSGACNNKN